MAAPTIASGDDISSENVLVLVLDDIGVDGLASYGLGSDLPSTPNIDALASKGVVFENAWSNPVCSPTRATIQTGRYPLRTGVGFTVTEYSQELALSEVTIPEMLKLTGTNIASGAFGKWHLGNSGNGGPSSPNLAGYDTYQGALINLHPPQNYFRYFKTNNGFAYASLKYVTSEAIDDARDWINSQRSQSKPWFAYVAFHAPHTPFHAPPSNLHSVDLSTAGLPKDDPRPYWKAMVEAADTEIGRLLSQISIDYTNTTVILLGDNGTHPAVIVPPFIPSQGKGTAYEGGVHVPFIVAGPDVTAPGRSNALISTSDIFATVSEVTGANYAPLSAAPGDQEGPNTLDSVSLVPYLKNPKTRSIRRFLWAEMFRPTNAPATIIRRAVRNQRFKLIMQQSPTAGSEMFFFDLELDPFEQNDLLQGAGLTPLQQKNFDRLTIQAAGVLSSN